MRPIENAAVARVFDAWPAPMRGKLLALRELVFETAASTAGVGPLEETLKWGEPAYVTASTGAGSTVRLHWKRSAPDEYAVCFHCGTSLVSEFRERYAAAFRFDGNRRIVFKAADRVARQELSACLAMALTWHAGKRQRRGRAAAR